MLLASKRSGLAARRIFHQEYNSRTGKILTTIQQLGHLVQLDALLDLVLTTKEGLLRSVIISGTVGCSNHEIVVLMILRGVRKANGRVQTL